MTDDDKSNYIKMEIIQCFRDEQEQIREQNKTIATEHGIIKARVDDLSTVRATVLDIHGKVAVLEKGHEELKGENERSRQKHHDHATMTQQHEGKIEIMQNNIKDIQHNSKRMSEDVSTMRSDLKIVAKVIKWGMVVLISLITSGVDLKPVIKELLSYL